MGLIKAKLYSLKYVLIVPIFVFMTIDCSVCIGDE